MSENNILGVVLAGGKSKRFGEDKSKVMLNDKTLLDVGFGKGDFLKVASRIFGFYIRGLAEYSGYCMAAASFFALAYTFVEGGHIRITLFLEKVSSTKKFFLELWCLVVASFFSGYLAFYFIKMLIISYKFQERSEGADEILIWIPQVSVSLGSLIFFICVLHQLVLKIFSKKNA